MNISQYLDDLNKNSQDIFKESIKSQDLFGKIHHHDSYIYEFSEIIFDYQEKELFVTVSSQLDSSMYLLSLGLYRQAFSSLRLALEMGLATIYFSANKMELQEWLVGSNDIKWSILIDEDKGVLSKRFVKAFYEDCSEEVLKYNSEAKMIYRKLSEFVHGNKETWTEDRIKLNFDEQLLSLYSDYHERIVHILLFIAFCRYQALITEEVKEDIYFIPEVFNNIDEIRILFGQS